MPGEERTDPPLIEAADALHGVICDSQRRLFALIAEIDRNRLWKRDGARDISHWLWIRYGLSNWKAKRWVQAAYALESLPALAEAFSSGRLGVDKVVELTRFATADTERELLPWADRVSSGAIRHRAEVESQRSLDEAEAAERYRSLSWWHEDEGRRFCQAGCLPAAQGAIVPRALDRLAEQLPVMPGEGDGALIDARRADALVTLCSARVAVDPDPDRATVVVHARLETLISGDGGCEIEGGGVMHAETAKRLLCTARVQTVIEDASGQPLRLGRTRREPPQWMVRQLRYRDVGCRFPGCGSRRFTHAHHVVWWEKGGATDLDNLVLVCGFHHRLVHEYGWRLTRERTGEVRWFRPGGRRYLPGPAPARRRQKSLPVRR